MEKMKQLMDKEKTRRNFGKGKGTDRKNEKLLICEKDICELNAIRIHNSKKLREFSVYFLIWILLFAAIPETAFAWNPVNSLLSEYDNCVISEKNQYNKERSECIRQCTEESINGKKNVCDKNCDLCKVGCQSRLSMLKKELNKCFNDCKKEMTKCHNSYSRNYNICKSRGPCVVAAKNRYDQNKKNKCDPLKKKKSASFVGAGGNVAVEVVKPLSITPGVGQAILVCTIAGVCTWKVLSERSKSTSTPATSSATSVSSNTNNPDWRSLCKQQKLQVKKLLEDLAELERENKISPERAKRLRADLNQQLRSLSGKC